MKVKIIGTGSLGNCYVVEDSKGRCLMLECGVAYTKLLTSPHWCGIDKIDALLVTHKHKDHSLELPTFRKLIDTIIDGSQSDLQSDYDLDNWYIVPVRVFHNVQCHGYYIMSKNDYNSLVFFTDMKAPKATPPCVAKCRNWLYEVNYDEVTAREAIETAKDDHLWFNLQYHNSLEEADKYFKFITKYQGRKVDKIVTIHASKDYLDENFVVPTLSNYAHEVVVGKDGNVYNFGGEVRNG